MERIEANKFLPFGVSLKEVLQHTSFKGINAKQLLRQKGIFIESNDENETFPLLTTTLLSPIEFETIKDKVKAKEDSEKLTSRNIAWDSSDSLIQSVPQNLNINGLLGDAFAKFKVTKPTNFAMVDDNPDKIKMTFKCETNNFNSSWYRTKNEFKGEVILEKIKKEGKVYLQMIYTSPETLQVSDKIVSSLVKHFKTQNCVPKDEEEERILYKNFDNEQRIQFLLSLVQSSNLFAFNKITDLVIGPDPSETLPSDFEWLNTGKVKELIIKGDTLQDSVFIKNTENYKYLELSELEVSFNFNYFAAEGSCKIRFGFDGYFRKRLSNIEFSAVVENVLLKDEYAHVRKDAVIRHLMQEFQKLKSGKYNSHLENISRNNPILI